MNDHPVLDPSWSSVTIIPNWIQLVTIGGTLERPQDCWSTARWTWDDSKWDVFPGFFQELRKMMITSERTWFQNWEDFVELLFSSFSLRTSFFGLFTTILVGSLRPQFRDLARFLDVRRQRFTGLFEGKITVKTMFVCMLFLTMKYVRPYPSHCPNLGLLWVELCVFNTFN